MKLKHKIPILTILLLLISTILLLIGSNRVISPVVIEGQQNIALGKIGVQIHKIERLIRNGKKQLESIEDNPLVKEMNWATAQTYLEHQLENSDFQKLGIVYLDKTYHITSSEGMRDISERDYVQDLFRGHGTVSDPLYSISDGAYQIVLGQPIIIEGEVKGALIGTILIADFEEKIYGIRVGEDGHGFLINEMGKVLLHPKIEVLPYDNLFTYLGESPIEQENGHYQFRSNENGELQYAFYERVEGTTWYVIATISESELYQPINELRKEMSIVFLGGILLIGIGVIVITRQFLKPMQRLLEAMKKVEVGDYTTQVLIEKDDEIGALANQFNLTIEAISSRDEELQALNEELLASFEEINDINDRLVEAHQEISKRLQHQKLINQLGETLYGINDLETLFEMILLHTQEIMNANRCIIHLYNDQEKMFIARAYMGYEGEQNHLNFHSQEGTFKWILENKKELIIKEVLRDERFVSKSPINEIYQMLLQVPILNETNEVIGTMGYSGNSLNLEHVSFVKQLTKMISIALQNSQLVSQIESTYINVIIALVKAIELKDSYTRGHSERVMEYSLALGEKLNLSKEEMEILRYGSILHDIGKLAVPDEVLTKDGKLTYDEYEMIKEHPERGEDFIVNLKFLEGARMIIRNHHERIDGTGYPDQLNAGDLSVLIRIVTIADAYDAMTSQRSYRPAMTKKEATQELKKNSGSQFDETLVRIFTDIIEVY
ncbi:metal dependent phosphohydrolase [Alkaliphilus metalliredigens QYMF]|uniref:Metal dependent phosphohydrolase n=1 Tax=Alkaliphilus metalliredigens (strain QYMF) TaxID=293826 RepID=A6TMP4_ALKMQ|nr:HD domain-containing phosphohydrolase [Alkaliphilus metalliredigens]ABR47462.1 metal dependent phosphohydrolase [Alkaliphilus metalliredigens QYMF]